MADLENYKRILNMVNFDDSLSIKQIEFKLQKYVISASIGLEALKVDSYLHENLDQLSVRLSKYIVTDDKSYTLRYSKNIWEHFKLDYMPKWFIKKYPVKYTEQVVDFRVIYPKYKLNNDQLGKGIVKIISCAKPPIFYT